MLVNLSSDFLSLLEEKDPLQAYQRFIDEHRPVLHWYWHNYVLDLDSPHAEEIMARTISARRDDLRALLTHVDVESLARDALERCEVLFEIDRPVDVYLMVGVGGANAGELVVAERGIAFICLEHFTGRANPETYGLGLSPELIPLWIAHELAHTVRYTSPASRSEMTQVIKEDGGFYDYWESGSRAKLQELLVNEGLAVSASMKASPGFEPWIYFGYGRRQYRRLRELEAFLRKAVESELDQNGLGYRLRYLTGGMSPAARLVAGKVIPERAGYYLGQRMVDAAVRETGIARALRNSAEDCLQADRRAAQIQSA